jgi:hypothetical protein
MTGHGHVTGSIGHPPSTLPRDVDLRTGHVRRVAAGTRGWCRHEIEYVVTGA